MFRRNVTANSFIEAAASGNLEIVQQYINENKASIFSLNCSDKNGNTALSHAVMNGRVNIIYALLGAIGVDVNAANHSGNTPLMKAVNHRRLDIVNILLAAPDIKVNALNQDGYTALMKAVIIGNLEITRALLNIPGINLRFRNIEDRNALDEAVAREITEIANLIKATFILQTPFNPEKSLATECSSNTAPILSDEEMGR